MYVVVACMQFEAVAKAVCTRYPVSHSHGRLIPSASMQGCRPSYRYCSGLSCSCMQQLPFAPNDINDMQHCQWLVVPSV